MNKKGQITVFLIMGILILGLFAGIYYVISTTQKEVLKAEVKQPLSLKVKTQVASFVSSCVKQVAVPGFYLMGYQGGLIYADDPTKVLVTENNIINYGYLDGVNQFSTIKINDDLTTYLNDSLDTCLEDFSFFKTQGITIKPVGDLKVFSTIGKKDVIVKLKYPLNVDSGNSSLRVEDFSAKIPIRLGTILDQANKIIARHKQNPVYLDMNYMTTFDTFVTVFPFDEEITIYSISDEKSIINEAPFAFIFAIKENITNTAPKLEYISDKILAKGVNFAYELDAEDDEDDALKFYSNSKKFPVSKKGLLNVTINQAGTYYVDFGVKDTSGLKDEQKKVRFKVE